jgi:DNA-directed RNA polymerase subunit RPC12/RpoP
MLGSMQEVLEYGFKVLNEVYYDNELPDPIITIMSSPRTNGHFTVGRVWKEGDEQKHEINISAEHLDRPIEHIMATLQHECIHYYCNLNDISDTSQGGRYHNKNFKREAEQRGLIISQGKYIGWSLTEPSKAFIEILRQYNIAKPVDINRAGTVMLPVGGAGNNGLGTAGKKTSTRKYICPNCGNSFRATKDINVMCIDCFETFVKVEK